MRQHGEGSQIGRVTLEGESVGERRVTGMVKCPHCGTVLYSTSEAAEMLGIGTRTAQRWAGEGRFPNAVRDTTPPGRGPRWLIPSYDVEAIQRER